MHIQPFKEFTLQWHITNACQMNCRHCYIGKKIGQELNLNDFRIGLSHYVEFLKHYHIRGRIYLTGGDPLLHGHFWEICHEIKKHKIELAIMGNYHLLTPENLQQLKKLDLRFYQLSIEGLKSYHDSIRGKGTFNKAIKAIDVLENSGIKTVANFTLVNENIKELIPLVKLLSKTKLSRFDFVRGVQIGGLKGKKVGIKPEKFKALLYKLLELSYLLEEEGRKLEIDKKDHLWKALYDENEKLRIDLNDQAFGCGMGYRHFTITAEGNIMLCRKIEIIIGNLFRDSLINLYQTDPILFKILDNSLIEGCSQCKLKNVCRGCPAVNYAIYHNFKKKDLQCWN